MLSAVYGVLTNGCPPHSPLRVTCSSHTTKPY